MMTLMYSFGLQSYKISERNKNKKIFFFLFPNERQFLRVKALSHLQ